MKVSFIIAAVTWTVAAMLTPGRVGKATALLVGVSLAVAGTTTRQNALSDNWHRIARPAVRVPWCVVALGMLPALVASWISGRLQARVLEVARMRIGARSLFVRLREHSRRVVVLAAPSVVPWVVDPSAPVAVAHTDRQGVAFLQRHTDGQLVIPNGDLHAGISLAVRTGATVVYGLQGGDADISVINYGTFAPEHHLQPRASSTDVDLLAYIDYSERSHILAKLRRSMAADTKRLEAFVTTFSEQKKRPY